MEELIGRITAALNIDAGLAQNAVGAVLGFLQKEGPTGEISQLIDGLPGAQEAIDAAAAGSGGGGGLMGALGGLFGGAGGLMGLAGQLQGMGLGMDQIQTLAEEFFAAAREKLGEEAVARITAQIPGLDRFV